MLVHQRVVTLGFGLWWGPLIQPKYVENELHPASLRASGSSLALPSTHMVAHKVFHPSGCFLHCCDLNTLQRGHKYEPIGIILVRCVGKYPGKFSEFKCGFRFWSVIFPGAHRKNSLRCTAICAIGPWRILGASAPMEDRSNRWFPSHRALDHGPRPWLDFEQRPHWLQGAFDNLRYSSICGYAPGSSSSAKIRFKKKWIMVFTFNYEPYSPF